MSLTPQEPCDWGPVKRLLRFQARFHFAAPGNRGNFALRCLGFHGRPSEGRLPQDRLLSFLNTWNSVFAGIV